MRDIDYFEYERRKKQISNIGLTSFEYEKAIGNIVAELEADADRAEVHEAKTTTAKCPTCGGTLEPVAGYFDPRLTGIEKSDPREYEESWVCVDCEGRFDAADVDRIAA